MASPSLQMVATWIRNDILTATWMPLSQVCFDVMKRYWRTSSQEEIWEFVELNLADVAEHLRNAVAECKVDGTAATFEIDNEPSPYIRSIAFPSTDISAKLRRIDPFDLEKVCAWILEKLGAESHVTQRARDGGVDFIGVGLKFVPKELNVPLGCRFMVIGQAKRYKPSNLITEVRLRDFVGAATLGKYKLQRDQKIGLLTPTVCAYWTTSDFDQNAKAFARDLGLWYMDGRTLATYIDRLSLRDAVLDLPDKLSDAPTQSKSISESLIDVERAA